MPIRYEIDEARGLVVTTIEGPLSVDELRLHGKAIADDPRRDRPLDEIVDLTRAEGGTVPTRAIRDLAQFLRDQDRNTPGTKLAFVAPSDAAFGLARMFEVYRDHPSFEIRVFRDLAGALGWLGIEP